MATSAELCYAPPLALFDVNLEGSRYKNVRALLMSFSTKGIGRSCVDEKTGDGYYFIMLPGPKLEELLSRSVPFTIDDTEPDAYGQFFVGGSMLEVKSVIPTNRLSVKAVASAAVNLSSRFREYLDKNSVRYEYWDLFGKRGV